MFKTFIWEVLFNEDYNNNLIDTPFTNGVVTISHPSSEVLHVITDSSYDFDESTILIQSANYNSFKVLSSKYLFTEKEDWNACLHWMWINPRYRGEF